MAWVEITDAMIAENAPIDSRLLTRFRDNQSRSVMSIFCGTGKVSQTHNVTNSTGSGGGSPAGWTSVGTIPVYVPSSMQLAGSNLIEISFVFQIDSSCNVRAQSQQMDFRILWGGVGSNERSLSPAPGGSSSTTHRFTASSSSLTMDAENNLTMECSGVVNSNNPPQLAFIDGTFTHLTDRATNYLRGI